MNHHLPKHELFRCRDAIKSFKCRHCAHFETYKLVELKNHFKANHISAEFEEKLYKCEFCNYQSYSNFLFVRHKVVNVCNFLLNNKPESSISTNHNEVAAYQRLWSKGQSNYECCNLQSEERNSALDDLRRSYFPENDFDYFREPFLFDNYARMKPKYARKKLYNCEHCPYTTKETSNLKRHILRKHTDLDKIQWFECEHCPYKSKTKGHLKAHIEGIHDDNIKFKCDHCQFETKFLRSLQSHSLMQHSDPNKLRWFQCDNCTHKSKTKSDLKKHTDCMHSNKAKLKCIVCPFETKSKGRLRTHILVKHTDPDKIQWFECEHCSYKTKTKSLVKKHTDYVHGDKKYLKCYHCQFKTKFKYNLQTHIMVKHTDPDKIQWFECGQCPHKSKTNSDLKKHIDCMHSNKAKFKCDYCTFETKKKQRLRSHILVKHADSGKVQWFECEHCSHKSETESVLKIHMERKHWQIGRLKVEDV